MDQWDVSLRTLVKLLGSQIYIYIYIYIGIICGYPRWILYDDILFSHDPPENNTWNDCIVLRLKHKASSITEATEDADTGYMMYICEVTGCYLYLKRMHRVLLFRSSNIKAMGRQQMPYWSAKQPLEHPLVQRDIDWMNWRSQYSEEKAPNDVQDTELPSKYDIIVL